MVYYSLERSACAQLRVSIKKGKKEILVQKKKFANARRRKGVSLAFEGSVKTRILTRENKTRTLFSSSKTETLALLD